MIQSMDPYWTGRLAHRPKEGAERIEMKKKRIEGADVGGDDSDQQECWELYGADKGLPRGARRARRRGRSFVVRGGEEFVIG